MHKDPGSEIRMVSGMSAKGGGAGVSGRKSVFSQRELAYLLGERKLARIATVGKDGTPHIAPVGWSFNRELDAIEIGGHSLDRTKKFRDVKRSGKAAVVIDDVLPPWSPRGVEVRGRAEAVEGSRPLIRIYPSRIVSWGIENQAMAERHSRSVSTAAIEASQATMRES